MLGHPHSSLTCLTEQIQGSVVVAVNRVSAEASTAQSIHRGYRGQDSIADGG